VLERAAVEQHGGAVAAENGGRLVEDPARHAHRAELGALARERELQRLEPPVGDGAERKRNGDLERR
jgi:hypothetical protein